MAFYHEQKHSPLPYAQSAAILAKLQCTQVDGSTLEGGGQVLRNAISFAALMKKAVHIDNIRGGRRKPGLKTQHLLGIQFIHHLFPGRLEGAVMNSPVISYLPSGQIHRGQDAYEVIANTAASVGLIMQIALPCALFFERPLSITIGGGTNASFAPQIDYTTLVFQPMMKRLFNVEFEIDIKRRGYFPKGEGRIVLKTNPCDQIKAFKLTQFGKITRCYIKSYTARLATAIAERQFEACRNVLFQHLPDDIQIEHHFETATDSASPGSGIVAIVETDTGVILGGSGLGEKKKTPEVVGEDAAYDLLNSVRLQVCADEHLQDQLIQFMALAKGTSRILTGPISMHTKTAIHFSELLTGAKFGIEKQKGGRMNIISCRGIGYINKYYDDL